jgi:hypothetical protein
MCIRDGGCSLPKFDLETDTHIPLTFPVGVDVHIPFPL